MVGIAAQVSLYPLRSARLSPAIERAHAIFREHGLDVQAGTMSTIIRGDDETVFAALRQTLAAVATEGQEVVMVVTISNACPVPVSSTSSTERHA
jgi:uncharacterized protein YqgV (UPF0045/DUF77 family)